jgi:hypothetical protein
MLQKFNTPQEKINEAIISIKESSQFSIKGQLFGIAKALVGAIIFGLILAAFFKSKPKEQF